MRTRTSTLAIATVALLLTTDTVRGQEVPQPLAGSCCSCNGQVSFRSGLDRLKLGARLLPTPSAIIDPVLTGMTIELSNAGGTVFAATISSGEFDEAGGGRKFVYKNPAARLGGGIYSVVLQERSDSIGGYTIRIRAYGDLSAATLPEMTTTITIGTSSFFDVSVWDARKNGWQEKFPK